MAQWSWAEKILYPYAVILQTIPILALVPLIGIWMGYSFAARVAVCVLIAVFPMISNTFFGLQSATQAAHDLMTLEPGHPATAPASSWSSPPPSPRSSPGCAPPRASR